MTRKLILMLCLTAMALGMTAQNSVEQRINVIRQAYANRMNLMQNQPYDDDSDKVDRLTIAYSRMYPGTGMARFKDTYYWTDDENEEYMLKPTLYFMTRQYTMNSGIYKFYNEWRTGAWHRSGQKRQGRRRQPAQRNGGHQIQFPRPHSHLPLVNSL